MQKIDDLNLIHFRSIDQYFKLNCKSVGKITISIIKAAVLVSARKTTPPIRCNVDFDQFKGYPKFKKTK